MQKIKRVSIEERVEEYKFDGGNNKEVQPASASTHSDDEIPGPSCRVGRMQSQKSPNEGKSCANEVLEEDDDDDGDKETDDDDDDKESNYEVPAHYRNQDYYDRGNQCMCRHFLNEPLPDHDFNNNDFGAWDIGPPDSSSSSSEEESWLDYV